MLKDIVLAVLQLYLLVLVGRAVLSWFPIRPGTFMSAVNGVLWDVTEPVLRPVRRVVPRTGVFDLSFIIVFFGIVILQGVIRSS